MEYEPNLFVDYEFKKKKLDYVNSHYSDKLMW